MGNDPLAGVERPKMILFDYGHTLLYEPDWNSERGDRALLSYAVKNPNNRGVEDIRKEVREVFGLIDRVKEEMDVDIPCTVGDRLVYDHLGIEFSLSPLEQEIVFWTAACPGAVMPGAAEMLEELCSMGIRTGVVSNNGWSGAALLDRLNRLLPHHSFEFALSSADYMIRKPDRRLFEIALIKADLKPESVWFCGDHFEKDVVGARGAGLFPVWYEDDSVGRSPTNPKTEREPDFPCLHIREWRQMTDLLRES